MNIAIEFDREEDGRWIAEIPDMPGVMAYGISREDAGNNALAVALRVVADKLEHGEMPHPMHSINISRHESVAVC